MKKFTQVRITFEYLERLRKLADDNKRSMANTVEVLIDKEIDEQTQS
jgi:predicted DNA-binding protein